jgi:hypothetical protein
MLDGTASNKSYGAIFVSIPEVNGYWRCFLHGTTRGFGFGKFRKSELTASPVTPVTVT